MSGGINPTPRRTTSSNQSGRPASRATTKGVCSKYIKVCVGDSSGAQGTILVDSPTDFDLLDEKDGLMIAFVYSTDFSFKESGESYAMATFLGNNVPVYKRSANGTTELITGTQLNGGGLIVLLVSHNDIPATLASTIIGSITTTK
jgi:hypothetical protein